MKSLDDHVGVLAVAAVTCLCLSLFASRDVASGAYILTGTLTVYFLILFVRRRRRAEAEASSS
ncbi:MAG: hypothetical protein NTV28_02450 [Propionibacteriales bacterium]|nr:hypothetical protein [Propionibacteriales bacterium]